MSITEDYVSREIYKLLLEKGFDGEIHTTFDKEGYTQQSITLQTAMKWLRKVYNIGIFPSTYCLLKDGEVTHPYGTCIINLLTYDIIVDDCLPAKTYEDAIEKALIYCLTNLI